MNDKRQDEYSGSPSGPPGSKSRVEAQDEAAAVQKVTVEGAVIFRQIQDKDKVPTMRDINRYVTRKHAADWKDTGIELGLSVATLDIIEKDHPLKSEDSFVAMVDKWIQRAGDDATWKGLEVALTNVNRQKLDLDPVDDVYVSVTSTNPTTFCSGNAGNPSITVTEDKRSSSVRDDNIIQYASSVAIRQLTAKHKFRSLPCLPASSTSAGNGKYSLASGDRSPDPPIRSMHSSANEHSTTSLHQQLDFPGKDLDNVVDTLVPQTEPKPVENSLDYLPPLVAKKSINWQNHLSLDSAVTMTTIMQEDAQLHDSEVKLEIYDNDESKFDDEPPELPPRLYSLSDFGDTESELSFDNIMEDTVEERTFENPLYQVIASCKPLGHEGEKAKYFNPLYQTLASIRKGMDESKSDINTLKISKAVPTNMCGYALINQPMGDTVTLSSVPARKICEEKYGVINQLMSDDLPLASSPARDEDVYGVVNQQICDNLPLASTPAGTMHKDEYGAVNQLMNDNLKTNKFSEVIPIDFYGFAMVDQPMSDNLTICSLSARKINEERYGVVNQLMADELPLASSPARDEDRYGVVNQLMSDKLSVASQPAEEIDKDGCCVVNQMMSDNLSLTNPPDRKISEDAYEVVIQPMTDSILFTTKKLSAKGHADQETISHTNEVFPSFQSGTMSSNCMYNLSSTPTLKELDQYITDMAPFYYDIGLELDIVNSKLKLIKNNPSLPDLKEKCLKMLEVWLEADASATWRKLCDALQEAGLSVAEQVLAEQVAKNVE